jgi:hypothetical protein
MYQKDAMCENKERAQGKEKLTANSKDGKNKRKSRKSQKGRNEHKTSKNFECNAESKTTEYPKPTTETAEQGQRRAKEERPKTAESKKQPHRCINQTSMFDISTYRTVQIRLIEVREHKCRESLSFNPSAVISLIQVEYKFGIDFVDIGINEFNRSGQIFSGNL